MIGLDSYSIPARLFPAVLAVLPVGLAVGVWFPQDMWTWGLGSGLGTTTGLALLMAEIARRHGRRLQDVLFERWGGKPTTQLLRHRDDRIDSATKGRYHRCLAAIVPGVKIPTAVAEQEDPLAADHVYDSCTRFLLEQTRSRKEFPLVFKELVSYGLLRNLLGMKATAIWLASVGLVACGVRVLVPPADAPNAPGIIAMVISAALLAVWVLRLNSGWVRDAAFDYAGALLASCDRLRSV